MTRQERIANTPTANEKGALKGAQGKRPSSANPFVTDSDPRLARSESALDQIPTYPRTLVVSQMIKDGWFASLVGPITIPTGVTLTILGDGGLRITE